MTRILINKHKLRKFICRLEIVQDITCCRQVKETMSHREERKMGRQECVVEEEEGVMVGGGGSSVVVVMEEEERDDSLLNEMWLYLYENEDEDRDGG